MDRRFGRLACGVLGGGALVLCLAAAADEVFRANLTPTPTGGTRAMVPNRVALSDAKPEFLKKEPAYAGKVSYGVVSLGDGKSNKITLALEARGARLSPRLYVDANGDGDLTNDTPVQMDVMPPAALPVPKSGGARSVSTTETPATAQSANRYGAIVNVLARYDAPGRLGEVPSGLQFVYWDGDLTYNRDYARVGTLKLSDTSYKVALVDQKTNGIFNNFQHGEDEPPVVTLLIDKDADGKFDPRSEAFDAAAPFRLSGGAYEVSSIDVKGTSLVLKPSRRKVAGGVSRPSDLKRGGEPIFFDARLVSGKSVSFPEDYKGKLVLLDFWAVWCPPCREEIPNIVAVYNDYHEAGFEILGVSLDKANFKQQLLDYMQQQGMTWPQIYDGRYWSAEIAKLYGIESIPQAYLVDGDSGTILAMGDELRGEGLREQVVKALRKKKRL